ncbi:hypothetical protein FRC07_005234 [Ceratobasidium sp. 392]|nr:hypothetical protein FRC07_005234 [Ceratobasidium sp. 392]
MSNGFVVFTCEDPTQLEVWRWAQDQATDPAPMQPELHQISMYQDAMRAASFDTALGPHRGELVPTGILRSRAGDRLWLWDIRARRLVQTINLEPSPFDAFGMLYVDVNETHAFVATHTQRSSSVFLEYAFESYREPYRSNNIFTVPSDIVMAVHVSPTGDDFVAITFRGFIFHGQGLCIINLESQPEEVFPVLIGDKPMDLYPFPAKFLNRVPPFGSEQEEFGDCSCLQITQEACWIAWQPYMHLQQEDLRSERKAVGMILFSEEEREGD